VIATMTVKRHSSMSKSKKPTSKTKAKAPEATSRSGNRLSGVKPSATNASEANLKELGNTKRVQIFKDDFQRLDALSETLGSQGQTPAEQLQVLLSWVEGQLQDAANSPKTAFSLAEGLNSESMVNEVTPLITQLLGTITALTQQFQQQQQTHLQLTTVLSQMLQGAELNRGRSSGLSAVDKGAVRASMASFKKFSSQDLKKSHAKGSAEEKLKRAFQSIVSYNDDAKRAYADKWAVNQNALAELTGCNRPAIKAFLKQYASEIDAHHQKHQILARHNYSHGKVGVKITDIIHW
jgi:hypothetical protein